MPSGKKGFRKGRGKTGGRKKGEPNKVTPWRETYDAMGGNGFLQDMVQLRQKAKYIWTEIDNEGLQEAGERITREGTPQDLALFRLISSMFQSADTKAWTVYLDKIYGVPMEYLAPIIMAEEAMDSIQEEFDALQMDKGLDFAKIGKFLLMNRANIMANEVQAKGIFKLADSLSKLVEKEDQRDHRKEMLKLARNGAFTQEEMEEVLNSISDTFSLGLSTDPEKFKRLTQDFMDRLERTDAFKKIDVKEVKQIE